MIIAVLITRLDYSGGPKMLAWVANQFAKAGHEVNIIAVYSDEIGQPLEKSINFFSLKFKQSKNRFVRNTIENIRVQISVWKKLLEIRPNIVLGFLYPVDLYFTLINSIVRKYIVVLSQRFDPYFEKGLTSKVKSYIVSKADGIVFQTHGAYEFYKKYKFNNYKIISNPVTYRTLSYCEKVKNFKLRDNVIVLPARLDISQKRQDIMIKAFQEVYKRHHEMHLILLGNGPDRDNIKTIIDKLGLAESISIHSAVETAEEITYRCKIVCLTSDYEGMPNSLIEAMAMGINVVATDCRPGGAKELIVDGKNGFIVNAGDYCRLAERICYLLDNPSKADEIANEGKKIVNRLDESIIGKKWIEFTNHIINSTEN